MMNRTLAPPLKVKLRSNTLGDLLRQYVQLEIVRVPVFLGLHVLLGLLLIQSSLFSTAHAAVVLLLGLWWVATSPRLERVAFICAYVTGAETLWRMTKAAVPWEFGKYAIALMMILALLRSRRLSGPLLPFLFLMLLLPSLVLPLANTDAAELRNQVSYNLSGPFALAVCLWFFSHVRLPRAQVQRLFLSLMGPIIAIAAVTLYGILTAKDLVFSDDSNTALSGGFGPNQVSAILSLGALTAFLWALDSTVTNPLRVLMFTITLYLLTQSVMTFSRTGLYLAFGGLLIAIPFLVTNRKSRLQLLLGLILLGVIGNSVLWPRLDKFTEGALGKRFSDTQLSGRDSIVMADLQVFAENPVFGVGPGQTRHFRTHKIQYYQVAAHTEFSRLLSEHGLFGLLAIVLLLVMGIQHFLNARTAGGKALVGVMLFWSVLFMFVGAMRLAAPAFAFGLSAVSLLPEKDADPPLEQREGGKAVAPFS